VGISYFDLNEGIGGIMMKIEICPYCGWKICNISDERNDCYRCGATKEQREEELKRKKNCDA